jgi:hypothetical protein
LVIKSKIALLILFSSSSGEMKILDVSIVSGPQGGVATLQNKEIRKGERYLLYLLIVAQRGKDTLYFTEAPKLSLKGVKIEKSRIRRWDEGLGKLEIKWYKIEYKGDVYRNGPHNSGWWAKLEYIETPVEKWRNKWSVYPDVRPTILKGAGDNLGTMRFKVEIIYNGVPYSSPGIESVDKRGIKDEVHRISIREDDTYVGWLKAFFNLPYIWGSASINGEEPPEYHQAERFIGSDCSDFIVAAWRKKSGKDIPYLGSYAFKEGGFYRRFVREVIKRAYRMDRVYVDSRGKVVTVGEGGVKSGDILYFNGHIGVFSKDTEPFGILDITDLHIHTCFGEPEEVPLGDAFGPNFTVLRWKE